MLALVPREVDRVGARRFIEALGETTAAPWLLAGDVARMTAAARDAAMGGVILCAEKLGVTDELWRLADGVDTVAWYVLPAWCRVPRNDTDRRTRKFCVEAARLAAYAVLLRAHLAAADFELLSAPFQDLIATLPR